MENKLKKQSLLELKLQPELNNNQEKNKNKNLEEEYLNQLSIQEKTAFLIAKNHLGSSFHIGKSNGYNEWLKNKK